MPKRTADGRLIKGQGSLNPAGRPKGAIADLQAECRKHAPDAIRVLLEIARSKKARSSARVAAARELLDRGYGRAPQPIDARIMIQHLSEMSDADLAALEARIISGQTIDVDPDASTH